MELKSICLLAIFICFHLAETAEQSERVLSRRRRYLTFPTGSSLQLVYDTYYPFLDHSNVGVIGITAALAWELPNEPIHLDEALQGAYENGDLPLLNRNDDSNTTTTTSTTPWPHADRYYAAPQNRTAFAQKVAANPDNYYYINNRADVSRYSPATRPSNQYYYNSPPIVQQPAAASLAKPAVAFVSNAIDSFSNKLDYYFSKADKVIGSIRDMATAGNRPRPAANPWSNQAPRQPFGGPYQSWQQPSVERQWTKPKALNNNNNNRPHHFIHPIFKRHADMQTLSRQDVHHLKLHRTSRSTFYEKIIKFLDMRNFSGVDCVLKALCETGKRRNDQKPGPFLTEIMRALFSLPPLIPSEKSSSNDIYSDAHFHTDSCEEKFYKCKDSMWGPEFNFVINKMGF